MKTSKAKPRARTSVPRGPGERAGLHRETVLAAARRVADTAGVQELSMRRLASELGVAANALYSYFPDKASLLDALLDHLLGDIELPDLSSSNWQEALSLILRRTRRLLLSHPDLIPLFIARPGRGPHAIRLGDAMLQLISEAGIRGRQAVDALRILLIYTLGFAAHEAPRLNDPAGTRRVRESEDTFRLAQDRPHLQALSSELSRHPGDGTFETGLRWLLWAMVHDEQRRAGPPPRRR